MSPHSVTRTTLHHIGEGRSAGEIDRENEVWCVSARYGVTAGVLAQRVDQVQGVGRLLSTRHRTISLAGRGRLVVPDGFREFLGVEPGGDLLVVGAAVCVELWNPNAWSEFITTEMPDFRRQLDELTV